MTVTLKRRSPQHSDSPKFAVLMDGSALFLASRYPEERKLDYFRFVEVLTQHPELAGLMPAGEGSNSIWTLWTAADPHNPGQNKFLEFAEQRLGWAVRGVLPHQAYIAQPADVFGAGEVPARASRLIRFDAQIGFAMGALGHDHRLVVVTDSYAVSDSMMRVNQNWQSGRSTLAFFGRALDSRWRATWREPHAPYFLDLDDHEADLFGLQKEVHREVVSSAKRVY